MPLLKSALSILLVLFIFMNDQLPAQNGSKQYTITEHIKLLQPSSPVISPNGDKVVFTIRKPDLSASKWNTQVYLADVKNGNYTQISPSGENCINPQFSPDQKWITFQSKRESSTSQLWALSLNGGNPVKWTSLQNDAEESIWSEDSKLIGVLSDEYNAELEKQEQINNDKKINAVVYPRKNPAKVLTVIEADSKKVLAELKLDPGAKYLRFSHDGTKIIYQTNYTGEFNDEQKYDIFATDLKNNKTQLTSAEGPETLPFYGPGDKKIAFISQIIPDIEFAETDLNIMDADGKNTLNLTKDFNFSVAGFVWKDKETIVFSVKERTYESLFKVNINTGKIEKFSPESQIITDASFSKDGSHLCFKSENGSSLGEIYVDGKKITNFSDQLNVFALGTQEVVTYRSKDNKFDIDAILLKPKDFNPANKYPLILMLHGGPYGSARNVFSQGNAARVFAEQGYVVLLPNPRGSEGYSSEFAMANRYDLGGGDYEDVMAGVDYLISKGFIDGNNM